MFISHARSDGKNIRSQIDRFFAKNQGIDGINGSKQGTAGKNTRIQDSKRDIKTTKFRICSMDTPDPYRGISGSGTGHATRRVLVLQI
jgi:hypothetical protein